MRSPITTTVVQAFTSNRADHPLAYAFCHGERGAMTAPAMFSIRA